MDVRIEPSKRRLRGKTTLVCAVEEGGADAFDGVRARRRGIEDRPRARERCVMGDERRESEAMGVTREVVGRGTDDGGRR